MTEQAQGKTAMDAVTAEILELVKDRRRHLQGLYRLERRRYEHEAETAMTLRQAAVERLKFESQQANPPQEVEVAADEENEGAEDAHRMTPVLLRHTDRPIEWKLLGTGLPGLEQIVNFITFVLDAGGLTSARAVRAAKSARDAMAVATIIETVGSDAGTLVAGPLSDTPKPVIWGNVDLLRPMTPDERTALLDALDHMGLRPREDLP